MILHLLSHLATIQAAVMVLGCLTAGMYYLSELIEEYTVLTKKLLTLGTFSMAGIHILLLLFEGLPFFQTSISLVTLLLLSLMLPSFPNVSISSPTVIMAFIAVIINHFSWFSYFTTGHYYPWKEVASFFGICVWTLPLLYFLSLSANEYALPTFDQSPKKRTNLLKSMITFFTQSSQNSQNKFQ
jgi:hypothetical protein